LLKKVYSSCTNFAVRKRAEKTKSVKFNIFQRKKERERERGREREKEREERDRQAERDRQRERGKKKSVGEKNINPFFRNRPGSV